jgi:hypothetical protein
MDYTIKILQDRLWILDRNYKLNVTDSGKVSADSPEAIENRKNADELRKAIELLTTAK